MYATLFHKESSIFNNIKIKPCDHIIPKLTMQKISFYKGKRQYIVLLFSFLIFFFALNTTKAQNTTLTLTPLQDITLSCGAVIPTQKPIAKSVCEAQGGISFLFEDIAQGTCTKYIYRTWTVTDACKSVSKTTQKITVIDNKAPLLIGVPSNTTVECSSIPAFANVSVKDACGNGAKITTKDTKIVGKCEFDYKIKREYTASDLCGNVTTKVQYITVKDSKIPIFTVKPSNITASCSNVPSSIPTVTDNCTKSSDIILMQSNTKINGNCEGNYTIKRSWTAIDKCGNRAYHTQYIYVKDNTVPTVAGVPADLTLECSQIVPTAAAKLNFTDNCTSLLLQFFIEKKKLGICAENYTLTREWSATDNCLNKKTVTQTITVKDSKAPVFLNAVPNISVECTDLAKINIRAEAIDNCDKDIVVTVGTQKLNGTCPNNYQVIRTFKATDNCANTATFTQNVLVKDTQAPIFKESVADVTIGCKDTLPTLPFLTASDNCDKDLKINFALKTELVGCNVHFKRSWTVSDACGNATSKVQIIAMIDNEKPVFTVIPLDFTTDCSTTQILPHVLATDNCDANVAIFLKENIINDPINPCKNKIIRTWTATDKCGNSETVSQTVTLIDLKMPSFVTVPANMTIECGQFAPVQTPVATDDCTQQVKIIYEDSLMPNTDSCGHTILRTWTAEDLCGNKNVVTQTITTLDTAPPSVDFTPTDITVFCTDTIPAKANLTFSDVCSTKLNITYAEKTTVGATPIAPYFIERTWIAKDDCGNQKKIVQHLKVTHYDVNPPKLDTLGMESEIYLECSQADALKLLNNPIYPKATNICDTLVEVTFKDEKMFEFCSENSFIVQRTWTATDDGGNTATYQQLIFMTDQTPPMIYGVPQDLTIKCGDEVPIEPDDVVAVDECTLTGRNDTLEVNFSEQTVKGGCDGVGALIRYWKAVDSCGNQTILEQIITFDTTNTLNKGIIVSSKNKKDAKELLEKKNFEQDRIKVYPNPSTGLTFIHLPFRSEKVLIMNELGQIKQQIIAPQENTLRVDMKDWSDGIYFIYVSDGIESKVSKLILQKN